MHSPRTTSHLRPVDTTRPSEKGGRKLYVLDTNVLIHDPACLFHFEENDLFIPFDVFEELDGKKTGRDDVAFAARAAIRHLRAIIGSIVPERVRFGMEGHQIVDPMNPSAELGLLYIQSLEIGEGTKVYKNLPREKADNRILAAASSLIELNDKENPHPYAKVSIVSKDLIIAAKARGLDIHAEDYSNDQVVSDADLLSSGMTELPKEWWDEHIGVSRDEKVRTDLQWKGGTLYPNQLIHDGERRNFIVKDVSRTTGVFTAERARNFMTKDPVLGINARNRGQNFAFNLLLDPRVSVVTILGPAGTGKTLLALVSALCQIKNDKIAEKMADSRGSQFPGIFKSIIMTRATVPVGEEIGYLPGTEEDKMNPWMGAIDDNIEIISESLMKNRSPVRPRTKSGAGADEVTGLDAVMDFALQLRTLVRAKSMSMMRGRTFNDRCVIIDEAQNLTPKQVKTLVSRIGPGSKVVLMGNLSQIDTPYLTENSSGLTYLADRFKGEPCYGHVILDRTERSLVAELAEKLL